MNFRQHAQMFVVKPKRQLTHYKDLTMPRRNWLAFDRPSCDRLPSRSVCAADFARKAQAA
jgi:hypothetical protein